eukprot:15027359-Alexandrium_andersonii.AAC.1
MYCHKSSADQEARCPSGAVGVAWVLGFPMLLEALGSLVTLVARSRSQASRLQLRRKVDASSEMGHAS